MLKKFFNLISLFIISFLITACSTQINSNDLRVDIIDVGQGDSSLIMTPDNRNILIDTGEEEFSRSVIRDLKKNHIKKIDMLIGTHSDSDHIGAAEDIINEVKTDEVILSEDKNIKPALKSIINLARNGKTKIVLTKKDQVFNIDNRTKILILSPEKVTDDPNKNSIVCLVSFDKYRLIFTGDADSEIEKQIIKDYNLPHCDFLKVGHHGSKTSSSEEFIRTISPTIASISCGYKNRYGHPSKQTLETLTKYNCNIYRTDKLGTLKFYFGPNGIFYYRN